MPFDFSIHESRSSVFSLRSNIRMKMIVRYMMKEDQEFYSAVLGLPIVNLMHEKMCIIMKSDFPQQVVATAFIC